MLSFALLPFFAFGLLALMPDLTGGDDTSDNPIGPDDPDMPVDPIDPVDPATLGASFEQTDAGVTIEFGENETGRLAIFTYVDTEDSETDFLEVHEARYYLVPEGVDWPDNTSETSFNIPGDPGDGQYLLSDFEEEFDLVLLGTVDLLAMGNDTPTDTDMADALPALTSNVEAEYYYLEANTDGDELIEFLQEGYIETRNGAAETVVTADTTGTDESEWFTTTTDAVSISAGGGDDVIDANAADANLFGGTGEDTITSDGMNVFIDGGAGDDDIFASDGDVSGGDGADVVTVSGSGDTTVNGDDGDDIISTFSLGTTVMFGGSGNDNLQAGLAGSEEISASLYGGEGDDFLSVGNGATGFGEDGADRLQMEGGSTAFGGIGDDTFAMLDFFDAEGGLMRATGGAGADVFDVTARNVTGTSDQDVFAQIEDFDSDEDTLIVSRWSPDDQIVGVRLQEDDAGAFTDVNVDYRDPFGDIVTVTIRLTDAVDVSASDIVLR
ncbi:calcium-binding protein [Pseudooctadecabacter sp.]|uniref:calcium-binding protein n=1 Tax=Pseudooctadecabacter sp. TaxID=1966338 RepID=UPI0025ECA203|nr:hypothetical protein [Pseudooctadecabacter sp.]